MSFLHTKLVSPNTNKSSAYQILTQNNSSRFGDSKSQGDFTRFTLATKVENSPLTGNEITVN